MIRKTSFNMTFTLEDEVDVAIKKEDGRITAFSVNYRTKIDDKWRDVIRYDTAHGTIHAHRFWESPKMIPIAKTTAEEMKRTIIDAIEDIKFNWWAYKKNFVEKARKDGR